jgi:hypothetical protein
MVLWRSQADEIEALRAEVRNLRGEMAAQQAELEEMDTLVDRWCFATAWRRCGSFFGEPRPLRVVGKRSDRGNWRACIGAPRKHRIDLFAESVGPRIG